MSVKDEYRKGKHTARMQSFEFVFEYLLEKK